MARVEVKQSYVFTCDGDEFLLIVKALSGTLDELVSQREARELAYRLKRQRAGSSKTLLMQMDKLISQLDGDVVK